MTPKPTSPRTPQRRKQTSQTVDIEAGPRATAPPPTTGHIPNLLARCRIRVTGRRTSRRIRGPSATDSPPADPPAGLTARRPRRTSRRWRRSPRDRRARDRRCPTRAPWADRILSSRAGRRRGVDARSGRPPGRRPDAGERRRVVAARQAAGTARPPRQHGAADLSTSRRRHTAPGARSASPRSTT